MSLSGSYVPARCTGVRAKSLVSWLWQLFHKGPEGFQRTSESGVYDLKSRDIFPTKAILTKLFCHLLPPLRSATPPPALGSRDAWSILPPTRVRLSALPATPARPPHRGNRHQKLPPHPQAPTYMFKPRSATTDHASFATADLALRFSWTFTRTFALIRA